MKHFYDRKLRLQRILKGRESNYDYRNDGSNLSPQRAKYVMYAFAFSPNPPTKPELCTEAFWKNWNNIQTFEAGPPHPPLTRRRFPLRQ